MQIVIDIDDKYKDMISNINPRKGAIINDIILDAVKNGTPLPKGHGRLIDGSKLKVELECGIRAGNYERGYDRYAHINSMDDCVDAVEYADTVIKADAESEEV